MKKYYLLLATIVVCFFSACCPESKCRSEYGLIKPEECPTPDPPSACAACASGVAINTITKDAAQVLIANAQANMTSFKWGIAVDPCQLCLISQASQSMYVSIGLQADNISPVLIAKYIFPSGLDSAYANVTATAPPGGPLCPPGTRCN